MVRTKDVRSIMMQNKSSRQWVLSPIVEGEFFTGQQTFVVESQSSKAFEVEYKPLVMTTDEKHTVSLYKLQEKGKVIAYISKLLKKKRLLKLFLSLKIKVL